MSSPSPATRAMQAFEATTDAAIVAFLSQGWHYRPGNGQIGRAANTALNCSSYVANTGTLRIVASALAIPHMEGPCELGFAVGQLIRGGLEVSGHYGCIQIVDMAATVALALGDLLKEPTDDH